MDLQQAWRSIWEDHIVWTRSVIVAVLDNGPASMQSAYINRLLLNAYAMGAALEPQGYLFAARMRTLLKEHLTIAVDVLRAAKAPSRGNLQAVVALWQKNGQDLAQAMAMFNPSAWPIEQGRTLWAHHLDATLNEATAHLQQNWPAEIAAWQQVSDGAMMMADWVVRGLKR